MNKAATDTKTKATNDRQRKMIYDAAFDTKMAAICAQRTPTLNDYEAMRQAARDALAVFDANHSA